MTRTQIWVCVHRDLGDMALGKGYDKPLGHGQYLCEIQDSKELWPGHKFWLCDNGDMTLG